MNLDFQGIRQLEIIDFQIKMEDFLNEINEQFLQERLNRLRVKIELQRKAIFNKILGYQRQLVILLNSRVTKKSSNQSNDNVSNAKRSRKLSESKSANLISSKQLQQPQQNPQAIDKKQCENCFIMFEKACVNIINVYFPLLMDEEFLCLQSQAEIMDKIAYFSGAVEKTAMALVKKLSRPEQIMRELKLKKEKDNEQQKEEEENSVSCENQKKTKKIKKKKANQESSVRKKGKNTKIPHQSTYIMQKWLLQNFQDPYPSLEQKHQMAQQSGLTVYQVNNWFINSRQRVIKKFLKKDNQITISHDKKSWSDEDQIQRQGKKKQKDKKRDIKSHFSQYSLKISESDEQFQNMRKN